MLVMCFAGDTFYQDRPGRNLCVNNQDLDCSNQVGVYYQVKLLSAQQGFYESMW